MDDAEEDNEDLMKADIDNNEDERTIFSKRFRDQERNSTIRRNNLNFRIPSTYDVKVFSDEEYGKDSWRYRLVSFLHSRLVQRTLFALLLLDVIILFIEVALLTIFPPCSIITRDAISCCPNQTSTNNLVSAAAGSDQHDICDAEYLEESPMFPAGCDSHKWHSVHTIEMVLYSFTMAILSIMMLEQILAAIALTPQVYFRQFFYALDFFIVLLSLVLEAVFHSLGNNAAQSFLGFLIIVRLWRFVRIAHGIIELTAEISQTQYEELLTYTEELEQLCQQHQLEIPDTQTIRELKHENDPEMIAEIEKEHRNHNFKHFDTVNEKSSNGEAIEGEGCPTNNETPD